MSITTTSYDGKTYQKRRMQDYRRRLRLAKEGDKALRAALVEVARPDLALVGESIVVEWL